MKALVAILGMTLVVTAAQAAEPSKDPKIERTVAASVTVTKVDVPQRHLTIRNDAGEEYTIDVDPEVKNLAKIKPGDTIVVTYHQSVAASMAKADDPTVAANKVQAQTAKPGEQPGASASTSTSVPVTIVSVDTQQNIVKFTDTEGITRMTDVVSPEGKAFAKKLKPGDKVMLTYNESVAISVKPTNR
jgi:translation elongation factor P/translation initiation factor 5A